jgi:hypothetical protein
LRKRPPKFRHPVVKVPENFSLPRGWLTSYGLAHFLGAGCSNPATIRAAVEVSAWFELYYKGEDSFLRSSFKMAPQLLAVMGTGGCQPEVTTMHRLPETSGGLVNWASSELPGLPAATRAAKTKEEKELISTTINELRGYLAIDPEPTLTLERGVGQGGRQQLPGGGKQQCCEAACCNGS